MIAGILLAAGESRRFGRNKLLVEVADLPLVCHSMGHCVASKIGEIHIVVRADDAQIEKAIARHFRNEPRIIFERNEDPTRGMMSSLKTGLRSLRGRCEGAMVLHADMPLVTVGIIDELIAVFERERVIVVPEYAGRMQHPRIIPEHLFEEFFALADTEKGTKIIEKYKDQDGVVLVAMGNEATYVDIDEPRDLDVFKKI